MRYISVALLALTAILMGTDQYENIRIDSGWFQPVDGDGSYPVVTFVPEAVDTASVSRMIIMMETGDRLILTVTNEDDEDHGFKWDVSDEEWNIPAGGSITVEFEPDAEGAYLFYDPTNYPVNIARGLCGVVIVKSPDDNAEDFVWFFNEHDVDWLIALDQGQPVEIASYKPEYFTINGNSYPGTLNDPLAAVTGSVGVPLNIWMVNGGLQAHSIHYHGYHVEVLSENGVPFPQPYLKDTIPVRRGKAVHCRLTPHQTGLYPVHDHSLTAVTARGFYPNGMLVLLNIGEGN